MPALPYLVQIWCNSKIHGVLSIESYMPICYNQLTEKLEFGGESPLTMRARLVCIRYCPGPLGIVTAEQLNKLEFDYSSLSALQ